MSVSFLDTYPDLSASTVAMLWDVHVDAWPRGQGAEASGTKWQRDTRPVAGYLGNSQGRALDLRGLGPSLAESETGLLVPPLTINLAHCSLVIS